ncbi:MAG: hypothetical protein RL329_3290, partial [Bacteroidota bacterium]
MPDDFAKDALELSDNCGEVTKVDVSPPKKGAERDDFDFLIFFLQKKNQKIK